MQKNIFFKNHFSNPVFCAILHVFGALAQLGARHTGSVEDTGSSPVCSIFKKPCKYVKMAYLQGFLFPIFQVCQYGPES